MADASHSMTKPAPQSVALYLPPIPHTGSLPSARTHFHQPQAVFRASIEETDLSDTVYSMPTTASRILPGCLAVCGIPSGGFALA